MSTPWQELGIEPTQDRHAIRAAYASRLKDVRPDEDATAFQRLREARDWALRAAAQGAAAESPPPPQLQESQPHTTVPGPKVEPAAAEQPADTVETELALLISPWSDVWNYQAWWNLLERIAQLPLDRANTVQRQIINAIASEQRLRPSANNAPEHRWRRDEVLLLLADEFGWIRDDGIFYEILPRPSADRISQMIHHAEKRLARRNANATGNLATTTSAKAAGTMEGSSPQQTRWREKVPAISAFDFNAFFASHSDQQEMRAYYDQARATSQWHADWYLATGMRSFLWTASYGMWMQTAMLLVPFLALITFIVTYTLELPPPDFLSSLTERTIWLTGIGLVLFAVVLPMVAAREWLIKQAIKWAARADQQQLKPGIARFEMLKAAGTQSRSWMIAYELLYWALITLWLFERIIWKMI